MKPRILNATDINRVRAELQKVGVHPTGIEIMTLKGVFRLVKFEAVDPKTANIVKQEMLARGGEVAVAETVGKFEHTKTDIIIMGTLAQYIRLVRKLKKQSYDECLNIASCIEDLLFENLNAETASVW